MSTNAYESPFSSRYASEEMQYVFSQDNKFKTWRKLWIALAKAEKALGINITDEQIAELEANKENINYEVAREREKLVRHDVMSHVYAYGCECPNAKGIIHLGATSCYVGDNTDIIIMREGLEIVRRKLLNVIAMLAKFANEYKDMPCLAYTHLQPAQLTTVGKRATLWINELLMDEQEIEARIKSLKLLGSKGTTGTQASFMELFGGDEEKCKKAEQMIANMRLLQNFKEMEEPFEKNQIGSSAMPYKRNPMRSERITSLARYVMIDTLNPAITAGTQWFERTLDDSANKRISVAEAFLGVDSILNIMLNICDGLVVYPKVIHQRVMRELPFMATENIMMSAVKKGGDRQVLHEQLRVHSQAAARVVKEEGGENDLIDRIVADPLFNLKKEEIVSILDPVNFTGRAPKQVTEFLNECVNPVLEANKDILGEHAELNV